MFCGNGGSAADAQHFAAELLVKLKPNINRKSIPSTVIGSRHINFNSMWK